MQLAQQPGRTCVPFPVPRRRVDVDVFENEHHPVVAEVDDTVQSRQAHPGGQNGPEIRRVQVDLTAPHRGVAQYVARLRGSVSQRRQ